MNPMHKLLIAGAVSLLAAVFVSPWLGCLILLGGYVFSQEAVE